VTGFARLPLDLAVAAGSLGRFSATVPLMKSERVPLRNAAGFRTKIHLKLDAILPDSALRGLGAGQEKTVAAVHPAAGRLAALETRVRKFAEEEHSFHEWRAARSGEAAALEEDLRLLDQQLMRLDAPAAAKGGGVGLELAAAGGLELGVQLQQLKERWDACRAGAFLESQTDVVIGVAVTLAQASSPNSARGQID